MWQINQELYKHLQNHARQLIQGAHALEERGEDASHIYALEEELSFLLIKLEEGHLKK